MTLSIRDATETYLELGQRIPIYLNGEIQIAWVLEQGLLDMAFVVRTFGIADITRAKTVSRGPRFHISFDASAADRVVNESNNGGTFGQTLTGVDSNNTTRFANNTGDITNAAGANQGSKINLGNPRNSGRYELMRCKVDSVSLGIMPGRRVAAVRWEGVSEGITYVDDNLQAFKNQTAG